MFTISVGKDVSFVSDESLSKSAQNGDLLSSVVSEDFRIYGGTRYRVYTRASLPSLFSGIYEGNLSRKRKGG
jgi:hypothetical protein